MLLMKLNQLISFLGKDNYMKKILILLVLLSILAFTGCTGSVQIGAIESSTKHEFYGSYYQLNGTKEKKLTVNENEPLEISTDISTKKGSIDVYIYKDKDDYNYEGHDIKTSSFTVTLSDAGNYTIKVVAKDHRGSYKFKW